MKINEFKLLTSIICPGCNRTLYAGYEINVYSGGPFICNNCHTDVTDTVYGRKKKKTKE